MDIPRLNGIIKQLEQGKNTFVSFAPADVGYTVSAATEPYDGFFSRIASVAVPAVRYEDHPTSYSSVSPTLKGTARSARGAAAPSGGGIMAMPTMSVTPQRPAPIISGGQRRTRMLNSGMTFGNRPSLNRPLRLESHGDGDVVHVREQTPAQRVGISG